MNHEALAARWNSTYPESTPVTARLGTREHKTQTAGPAFVADGECLIPIREPKQHVPIQYIQHRTVLSRELEEGNRLLGIPPLEELGDSPEPIDLRSVPREKWARLNSMPLIIPPDVARYIEGLDEAPDRALIESIEDRIATFYELPPHTYHDGEAWLVSDPKQRASFTITFNFDHNFIHGTAFLDCH